MTDFKMAGMTDGDADEVVDALSNRLVALIDLSLTLKHAHWNVTGQNFIAVHEMLDPQVDTVRAMVDETAERIATMGGVPKGTPGAVVEARTWGDYPVGKASVHEHLGELERVYTGVIEDHRKAQGAVADPDPVSEDLLIGQLRQLELFQWFIRAHLENSGGRKEEG